MTFTIRPTSTENTDAYIEGDLAEAIAAAYADELMWHEVTGPHPEGGTYRAYADWHPRNPEKTPDADCGYWGNGATPDEAMRYLIGAVLDPTEWSNA